MSTPITKTEIISINKELDLIRQRVSSIRTILPNPYSESDSNYLNMVRKRILEQHHLNIQVLSISQESFWCSVTEPGQKLPEGTILEDGDYYEDALLYGIDHALKTISGHLANEEPIVDIKTNVVDVVSDLLKVPKEELTPEADLTDLGADDLDRVELTTRLKGKFKLDFITHKAMTGFKTIGDIINYITHKIQ